MFLTKGHPSPWPTDLIFFADYWQYCLTCLILRSTSIYIFELLYSWKSTFNRRYPGWPKTRNGIVAIKFLECHSIHTKHEYRQHGTANKRVIVSQGKGAKNAEYAESTRLWPNAGIMLTHRLRRWVSILAQYEVCERVVFAGICNHTRRRRTFPAPPPALFASKQYMGNTDEASGFQAWQH